MERKRYGIPPGAQLATVEDLQELKAELLELIKAERIKDVARKQDRQRRPKQDGPEW